MTRIAIILALLTQAALAAETGNFAPLFNGRSLDGWVNVNCAPETWSVREGVIHCTGKPTGALRTPRQYENFVLELEWRHLASGGNAGIFIWATPIAAPGVPFLRSVEVQVLDNGYNANGKNEWYTTHGDVFPIHGSSMTPFGRHRGSRSFPSEEHSKPSPEWNQYRIVCTNGVIRLSVNGVEVSGGENCNYRKGYVGLESEGSPVEFRNIRLLELPSTGAPAEQIAPEDRGWRSLFTGLDFRGWTTNEAVGSVWSLRGERIAARREANAADVVLWSEPRFGDAEFVVDYQEAKQNGAAGALALEPAGGKAVMVPLPAGEPGAYRRYVLTVRRRDAVLSSEGKELSRTPFPRNDVAGSRFGLSLGGAGRGEFMNLYRRDL